MARAIPLDKEAIIAENSLLKALAPADRKALAGYAQPARFEAGGIIFQHGDPGESMMAVVRGRVKICSHSLDGKELVLNIMRPGEVFGEIALLDGEPRTADAVAMETCDLLVLRRSDFLPFLDTHPRVGQRLIAVLCQRLRRTSAHLEDTLFLEAPARLARALLNLGKGLGIPAKRGVCIDIRLSQQQLGAIVGITRESVNKWLGEWQRAGWIAVKQGYVTLLDADALATLGGEPDSQPAAASSRRPEGGSASPRI